MAGKRRRRPKTQRGSPKKPANDAPRHEPFRDLLADVAPAMADVPPPPPPPPPAPPKPPPDPLDDPALDADTLLANAFSDVAPLAPNAASALPAVARDAPEAPEKPAARRAPPLDDVRQLAAIFEAEADEHMGRRWVATGVDPRLAAQLADGLFRPVRSLDLHGHGEEAAVRAAKRFVTHEQRRGSRCVAIIHGRGRRSVGPPVLGEAIRTALAEMTDIVDAWAAATADAGGDGATTVLLAEH